MAILDTVVPQLLQLVTRAANDNDQGNKTPQQFAKEGRYDYVPSFAAAVIFLILFGAVLAANVFQFFLHRAWFWWVMIFAVACK